MLDFFSKKNLITKIVEIDNIIIKRVIHNIRFDINNVVKLLVFCLLVRMALLTFHYYFITELEH